MVSETRGSRMLHPYIVETPGSFSQEQVGLAEVARRLGNPNCTAELSIAQTRHEARLLMMLCNVNTSAVDCIAEKESSFTPDLEPASSYSDQSSLSSESSYKSQSRREIFTLSCPSLSLENPDSLVHGSTTPESKSAPFTAAGNSFLTMGCPAELLGRPLKVDDRDAIRLSGDAMSRNLLHSFQAMTEARLKNWIDYLSAHIAETERQWKMQGASIDKVQRLLKCPEAALIVALSGIASEKLIKVNSTSTSFEVLPNRAAKEEEKQGLEDRFYMDQGTKTEGDDTQDLTSSSYSQISVPQEESDYQYTAAYQLHFRCCIYLDSPAGPSEISLAVPGRIEGVFVNNATASVSELRAVSVTLNTEILASMIETGCRTIIKSSAKKIIANFDLTPDLKEEEQAALALTMPISTPAPSKLNESSSPSPTARNDEFAAATGTVYAALVTPREKVVDNATSNSSSKLLFPIPDDFTAGTPRRISPQPSSMVSFTPPQCASPPFAPRSTLTKRYGEMTFDDDEPSAKRRIPLISPLASETSTFYQAVPENGPSLPMLVEVACRAMPVG